MHTPVQRGRKDGRSDAHSRGDVEIPSREGREGDMPRADENCTVISRKGRRERQK